MYYLTDINEYFATWIGLNDISDEAGTDASRFVWTDGSDSTYRQFATSPESQAYPRATGVNWGFICSCYVVYKVNMIHVCDSIITLCILAHYLSKFLYIF